MNYRKLRRIAGTIFLIMVGVVVAAWLAFVPIAREPSYEFVSDWGEKGVEQRQFQDPTGIVVTGDEVFVADARNGRIQVFARDGAFLRAFGRAGKGLGELGRPMNLTIAGEELFVADYWNDRIEVFGLDGTPRRTIGRAGDGPGEFNAPGGVAVGDNGDLFVADFYNQRVQHLDKGGELIRQWGETGQTGIGPGQFIYPTDVALGRDGTLYVADGYADRVQAFASDGGFVRKWGGPFAMNVFGPFNGWFTTVTGIVVGPEGNVFVADFYNHRIQKFAPDGTFLTAFGEEGEGAAQMRFPIGVAVAEDGTVYVSDYGNNRIQSWRPAG